MPAPRPHSERIAARLATGPVGHFVCGVADWAELLARHTRHVISRARAKLSRAA